MRIYLNEYNPYVANTAYLPLVSGKLHAHALTDSKVRAECTFMPYLFRIDGPETILAAYDDPSVAAFSAAIWNEQLCLRVAAAVKDRWPDCLIVFGGTQVPHDSREYFDTHPFIDCAVRGEGEEPFRAVLRHLAEGKRTFADIANLTWREGGTDRVIVNPAPLDFERDLDLYPSPYLEGLFDPVLAAHPGTRFQAIIETNRGCPFHCTFCYWGKGGLSRKYRYFGLDRVRGELDWMGRNGILFVYNADSNFGMHRRDEDIAEYMVETRRRHGAPEKVVNLYGKNTNERIFQITRRLHAHGMQKGVGLSRQSMSPTALAATKRDNIQLDTYHTLQKRFEGAGIPVFCELILGLPGETYESMVGGVGALLELSSDAQLIIVLCELYPNTEMADPAYRERHGLVVRRNVSHGVHSNIHDGARVVEYIDYVIGSESMPVADWRRAGIFSWCTMTLMGLRLGSYLLRYLRHRLGVPYSDFLGWLSDEGRIGDDVPLWRAELDHYGAFMDAIAAGKGRGVVVDGFGDLYWAVEEASFLRLADRASPFFAELERLVSRYLVTVGREHDPEEVAEVIAYQRLTVPQPKSALKSEGRGAAFFTRDWPTWFDGLDGTGQDMIRGEYLAYPSEEVFESGWDFARTKLLYARRGGTFQATFSWTEAAIGVPPTSPPVVVPRS
ncbi:MAG: hypothetical protein K9H25_03615 [Rhodospirillum sp.]|nr:hypothetical protein [Rhodospirillum sp.]MCF8487626.1 hypothetical protein [Rhodospirillum sp.]MCF8499230.1 hypothetical protein [Rhodospirillum sp.]